MKNNGYSSILSILFFLLTLVVVFCSWIGSVYGLGEIQSLLSAEGIRWVLGHVVENYVQSPALGMLLVLFMGLGIGVRAGLFDALNRLCRKEKLLSRKERRALTLACGVFMLYALFVGVSLMLPWNFLFGVTGSWLYSPFAKGFVYILSVGVGLSGMVYGFVSDAFRTLSDIVEGMSTLIADRAFCFVSLFFIVQFFSSLEYTRIAEWMEFDEGIVMFLYVISCVLSIFRFDTRTHI